jgi:hypothetical protein
MQKKFLQSLRCFSAHNVWDHHLPLHQQLLQNSQLTDLAATEAKTLQVICMWYNAARDAGMYGVSIAAHYQSTRGGHMFSPGVWTLIVSAC